MTGFVAETPTFSANRRAAALLRRGVTNYMFALIKTLLGVEGRADDRVLPLGELAAAFVQRQRISDEHLAFFRSPAPVL